MMIVIVQERAGGDGDGDSDDNNDESGDGNYDGDSDEDVHVWKPFQQNKKLRNIVDFCSMESVSSDAIYMTQCTCNETIFQLAQTCSLSDPKPIEMRFLPPYPITRIEAQAQ